MKKIAIFILSLVLALAMFSFAACNSDDDKEPGETSITVTDQTGREVTIDGPAQKIVSGYFISTSACLALGLEDRLVGMEADSDRRYDVIAPDLEGKVKSGEIVDVGPGKSIDVEAILLAEPDLVILPKAAEAKLAQLDEFDIPAIIVVPESHNALIAMIEMIAKLTGIEDRAEQLVGYYNEKMAEIADLTKDIADGDKPSVYITNPSNIMQTAPKDMYQASIIKSAGGKNAADGKAGTGWITVANEDIAAMDIDIVIIPTNAYADGHAITKQQILEHEAFSNFTELDESKVFQMPKDFESWDAPCPSGILGTFWMVYALHGESVYSLQDLAAEAEYFYQTFYGVQIEKALITG